MDSLSKVVSAPERGCLRNDGQSLSFRAHGVRPYENICRREVSLGVTCKQLSKGAGVIVASCFSGLF
jgi:hypothetical protein